MENIIRGTTPSLIVDFADITDFTVQEIDEIALTVKSRTQTNIYHLENVEITSEMSEFNNPFGWILNLALSSDTSKIPAEVNEYKMYIDWFRIYKKAE